MLLNIFRQSTTNVTRVVSFTKVLSYSTKMPFYAVKRGRETGVFNSWDECEKQIKGFAGARYKKFDTNEAALDFVNAPHSPGKAPKESSDSTSTKSKSAEPAKRSHDEEGDSKGKKQKTDEKRVVVYTDGCCNFNGKHGACGGIGVYWGPDDSKNVSAKLKGTQTNNRAEIQAAIAAVNQAAEMDDIEVLEIRTDSQFMINCMTKWIAGWKKKGWVTAAKEPVKNKEDLIELDEAMEKVKVEWVHVDGHSGIPGNEAADKLAKAGSKLKE